MICAVLDVTPNDLLIADAHSSGSSAQERWLSRLIAAGRKLDIQDLKLAVRQVDALVAHCSELGQLANAGREKRTATKHSRSR
jgi:hypothetical protein